MTRPGPALSLAERAAIAKRSNYAAITILSTKDIRAICDAADHGLGVINAIREACAQAAAAKVALDPVTLLAWLDQELSEPTGETPHEQPPQA